VINLDPAVTQLPYAANIDIRDTVNYKEVMKQYNLGPNGGILTSANLFATRFDQVVTLLQRRAEAGTLQGPVLVDTPGQIEIFTWSASGQLVAESLASSFRTVIAFVLDTPRCVHPQVFCANMLQAVSILYRFQLPLVLCFNKTDVVRHEFALTWMADFEAFHDALDAASASGAGYGTDLARSLSLVLDEFYRTLRTVGVSAVTGAGAEDVAAACSSAGEEFDATYAVALAQKREQRAQEEEAARKKSLEKFAADHAAAAAGGGGGGKPVSASAMRRAEEADSDEEEEADADSDDER
jgi:hypothetical protein